MNKNSINRYPLFPLVTLSLVLSSLPLFAQADDRGKGHSRVLAQLTQFNGGCETNQCEDVQFSIHRAPVCPNGPNANLNNYSVSMVREFSLDLSGGASTLVRAEDGLSFNLSSTGLRRNAPYTVWWVAFNPGNECISNADPCSCSAASLRPGVDSVFFATGAMSDRLGTANFAGNIDYDEVPTGFDQVPFGGLFGVGILPGAEIHFVIRDHGRALRGGGRRDSEDDD